MNLINLNIGRDLWVFMSPTFNEYSLSMRRDSIPLTKVRVEPQSFRIYEKNEKLSTKLLKFKGDTVLRGSYRSYVGLRLCETEEEAIQLMKVERLKLKEQILKRKEIIKSQLLNNYYKF